MSVLERLCCAVGQRLLRWDDRWTPESADIDGYFAIRSARSFAGPGSREGKEAWKAAVDTLTDRTDV
jgi:hypothetical protein